MGEGNRRGPSYYFQVVKRAELELSVGNGEMGQVDRAPIWETPETAHARANVTFFAGAEPSSLVLLLSMLPDKKRNLKTVLKCTTEYVCVSWYLVIQENLGTLTCSGVCRVEQKLENHLCIQSDVEVKEANHTPLNRKTCLLYHHHQSRKYPWT